MLPLTLVPGLVPVLPLALVPGLVPVLPLTLVPGLVPVLPLALVLNLVPVLLPVQVQQSLPDHRPYPQLHLPSLHLRNSSHPMLFQMKPEQTERSLSDSAIELHSIEVPYPSSERPDPEFASVQTFHLNFPQISVRR